MSAATGLSKAALMRDAIEGLLASAEQPDDPHLPATRREALAAALRAGQPLSAGDREALAALLSPEPLCASESGPAPAPHPDPPAAPETDEIEREEPRAVTPMVVDAGPAPAPRPDPRPEAGGFVIVGGAGW